MTWTVFVEGGGKNKDLRTRCRDGFAQFLGPLSRTSRIVACGTRADAFKRLRIAIENDARGSYLLLVDSETVVASGGTVWAHVRDRQGDKWQRPQNAKDEHLHFMAVCMESWLVAGPESLGSFDGKDFATNALPQSQDLEGIEKDRVMSALQSATRSTSKGPYSKGKTSFAALGALDVSVVRKRMSYCERFVGQLTKSAE